SVGVQLRGTDPEPGARPPARRATMEVPMDPDSSPAQSSFDRRDLHATRMLDRLGEIGAERLRALTQRGLELGLEAAPSVQDRRITTFARGGQPAFAGINTFLKAPYCEDIRTVGDYEVAVVGAPFDMGTTYRSGARFGPQAVRRISALYDGYSLDLGSTCSRRSGCVTRAAFSSSLRTLRRPSTKSTVLSTTCSRAAAFRS